MEINGLTLLVNLYYSVDFSTTGYVLGEHCPITSAAFSFRDERDLSQCSVLSMGVISRVCEHFFTTITHCYCVAGIADNYPLH